MSDYRRLDVWQLAHKTRLKVYEDTAGYPASEQFVLVAQTRRAASSITSNIAEGAGRESRRDFARFLTYSMGSVNETEDHLLLARDLGYLSNDRWLSLTQDLARIRSMLTRLRQFMRRRSDTSGNGQRATGNG
jgi:four helix bundle protein